MQTPTLKLKSLTLTLTRPDAHRAGASYTLEASERLIALLFRRREQERGAHAK